MYANAVIAAASELLHTKLWAKLLTLLQIAV
jgi:hypothetical protein